MAEIKLGCTTELPHAEFIKEIDTWNSGGNVMLDIIHLKSGQVLVISDEVVCRYDSITDFLEDEGEYNYDKQCVELIDSDKTKPLKIGRPFEFNGINITNPYLSECGRFDIEPEDYYGDAYLDSLKPLEEDNDV